MWIKGMMAFLCALLVGGVAGWRATAKPAVSLREDHNRADQLPGRPKLTKDDFIKSARERAEKRSKSGDSPSLDRFAGWTNDEIRAALEAGLIHPESLVEYGKGTAIVNSLLGEWMRRDSDTAVAWYEGLGSPSVKRRLAGALASAWPADKAGQGLEFILAHRELFPNGTDWAVMNKNLEQRAIAGPAAVEDLLRLMREEELGFHNDAAIDFPKGFDFPSLMQGEEFMKFREREGMGPVVNAWFASDREQAFDWLVENEGVKSLKVLTDSRQSLDKDLQVWIAGKVERLDPVQQREFLDAVTSRWVESPSSLALFAQGIRNEALRDQLGLIGIQALFVGNARDVMPLLELLGTPDRRIEVLANAKPDAAVFNDSLNIHFDASDEALVRKKLAGWKASESKIESIISRFKK